MWLLVAPGWQCEREWARNGSVNGNGPGIGIVKGDGPGQQGWQWERARTTKGQIQEMGYRKLAESLQEVCRRRDQAGNRSDRLHHVTQPEARKYARVVASYTVSRETVALEGEGRAFAVSCHRENKEADLALRMAALLSAGEDVGDIRVDGHRRVALSLPLVELLIAMLSLVEPQIDIRVKLKGSDAWHAGRKDGFTHASRPALGLVHNTVSVRPTTTTRLVESKTGRDWSKRHQWGAADDESGSDIVTCDLMVPGMERPKCRIASL
ncbi:hypothetical protein Bbelb_436280 [Branchiostoma belcheri]|nr:hypothetical protein Bbelb_436280 [Branchiostoma belcheri]